MLCYVTALQSIQLFVISYACKAVSNLVRRYFSQGKVPGNEVELCHVRSRGFFHGLWLLHANNNCANL